MRKGLVILLLIVAGCYLLDDDARSDVYLTDNQKPVGRIVFKDTPSGLYVKLNFKNLPKGEHGFHIHENPNCEATTDDKGNVQPALKAGGHYDPEKTGKHLGPNGKGHKGDLPVLNVGESGKVKTEFYMPYLSVKEIRERSVIIHRDGDNYQDEPQVLGGGGKRIACGIIR